MHIRLFVATHEATRVHSDAMVFFIAGICVLLLTVVAVLRIRWRGRKTRQKGR